MTGMGLLDMLYKVPHQRSTPRSDSADNLLTFVWISTDSSKSKVKSILR
jgi:hypothetical protein